MALALSSVSVALSCVRGARDVAFGSYFLGAGAARDTLLAAARGGAHVRVTLQADPYRDAGARARGNAESARLLRDAGAKVTLLARGRTPFHLKAAVCDGVAYLDDRNWTRRGPELVIADDDPRDVALIGAAIDGVGSADPTLATRKDEALRRETALVAGAGSAPVFVETERLAPSPLTEALRRHARSGAPTTLIVGKTAHPPARERAALAALARDGVVVREHGSNQKLALAGDTVWIGSGNATGAFGRGAGQIEWGLLTRDPALVGAVEAELERDAAS